MPSPAMPSSEREEKRILLHTDRLEGSFSYLELNGERSCCSGGASYHCRVGSS